MDFSYLNTIGNIWDKKLNKLYKKNAVFWGGNFAAEFFLDSLNSKEKKSSKPSKCPNDQHFGLVEVNLLSTELNVKIFSRSCGVY